MPNHYAQDIAGLKAGKPKSKRIIEGPPPTSAIPPASDEARNAGTTKRGHKAL